MYSQNGTNEYIGDYSNSIRAVADNIKNAERLVIGIGSGMTSAGGLNYANPALAAKWYPEYYALGRKSIAEIMSNFWPTTINKRNAAAFWGFWVKHIYHIRYEPGALQPYQDLRDIVGGKEHFVCSTNVDGQLEKAGFDKANIFAPQGDYALFQCEKPCSQDVYDNRSMIETMLEKMPSPLEIRQEDIPRCPRCGRFLVPNLRCDYSFVEKPHIHNMKSYEDFVGDSRGKRLVLLELGVGFNTPVIIRYPFERIAASYPGAMLVRINDRAAGVPREIEDRAIGIQGDLLKVIRKVMVAIAH